MSLKFIFAASLVITFIAWYACSLIPGRGLRGILRATIISLLCSPGLIIGHGFAVVPSLFALAVQPSMFTLGPMLVVWLIALGVIFGNPALRNYRSAWPPSAEDIVLKAYPAKLVFFGIVAAVLMLALINVYPRPALWMVTLKYALFFAGAVANLIMCYWATRTKQANPWLSPLCFAAPPMLVTAPTVPFLWYGGGVIGGLIGAGRRHLASWVSLGVFAPLFANALFRVYSAVTAPSHVEIGGGVAGNAAMAALYAALGSVAWWTLRQQVRAGSKIMTYTG